MPVATRKATVIWEGDLRSGFGVVDAGSGAFDSLPVSFTQRLESESEDTSPEELIAAAHAACYAMSLSNTIASNGSQPERLEVTARCDLERTADGLAIKAVHLDVRGRVPRLEQDTFRDLALKAEQRCPVSNALRGSVAIDVTAELAS